MNNFRKLKVWTKAVNLATVAYKITNAFPQSENYGLTSQIRRSAVSVSSNIAEGTGRESPNEFCRYLNFAIGSSYELETQFIISRNLNYIDKEQFDGLIFQVVEIQKMLHSLKRTLV